MTETTKTCAKCGEIKLLTAEFWHRAGKTGWQRYCKPCNNEQARLWNKNNAAQHSKNHNNRVKTVLQQVRDLKEANPCMDCHVKYPFYVMDFDHRPGEIKIANISQMISTGAVAVKVAALWAEIAKCDIICANCHRTRTWERLQEIPA